MEMFLQKIEANRFESKLMQKINKKHQAKHSSPMLIIDSRNNGNILQTAPGTQVQPGGGHQALMEL